MSGLALQGPPGPRGAKGAKGDKGEQGEQGPVGIYSGTLSSQVNQSEYYHLISLTGINIQYHNHIVDHNLVGETTTLYVNTNSYGIANNAGVKIIKTTIKNSGIYNISYMTGFNWGPPLTLNDISVWVDITTLGEYASALNTVVYPSGLSNGTFPSLTGVWTGFVSSNATVYLRVRANYTRTDNDYYVNLTNGIGGNNLTITRLS
jgi:hypothetical protein